MTEGVTAGVAEPTGSEASGLVWLPLAGLVIVADQLAKWAVVSHLTPYQSVPVLQPVLDFTLVYNTGAAFSFLDGHAGWQGWLFTALGLIASLVIVGWLRRTGWRSQGLPAVSGALVLGGALGNVVDRVRAGHVVDFIDAHWNGYHFWAFNVADAAITAGAVIYLVSQLLPRRAALEARRGAPLSHPVQRLCLQGIEA
jgi:signal peptidase II